MNRIEVGGVARKIAVSIPRIALTPSEAAAAIGVGPDFFDANVAPEPGARNQARLLLDSYMETALNAA